MIASAPVLSILFFYLLTVPMFAAEAEKSSEEKIIILQDIETDINLDSLIKTLDLDIDLTSDREHAVWIEESENEDGRKTIIIKLGDDGSVVAEILKADVADEHSNTILKIMNSDGNIILESPEGPNEEHQVFLDDLDGEIIIEIEKLLNESDWDSGKDKDDCIVTEEVIVTKNGPIHYSKGNEFLPESLREEIRIRAQDSGELDINEFIDQKVITIHSDDGLVKTIYFDEDSDEVNIFEMQESSGEKENRRVREMKKIRENQPFPDKYRAQVCDKAEQREKRLIRKHHDCLMNHHRFELGFHVRWLDFDFEELNQVIGAMGFSEIADKGLIFNELDFSMWLRNGWKIGASGAWYGDKQSAMFNNNSNHLEVNSWYGGISIAREDRLIKAFSIEGEMLFGGGCTSMETAEVRVIPTFDDPAGSLDGMDQFKFLNSYIVIQPSMNMKYSLTPKLGIEGTVGYLKTFGGEWETDPFGYTVQGVDPDVPGGVNVSLGMNIIL